MIEALLEYRFLQHAFLSGLLASVVCGIIGVVIVEKKLVMMSGGIAHASYGGVGFGYYVGIAPIAGAFLFALLSALGIGYIKRRGAARSDVVIGLFWSLGMALGILFIALRPGYPPDVSSYLFGNILSVTRSDLLLMLALTAAVAAVILVFFARWKAYLFDDEFVRIKGINTALMEYLLLVLVAMTVVVLIRVVGIILVLALLTAPAAAAAQVTANLKNRMAFAALFGMVSCFAGLAVSYRLNIASGAVIVMVSAALYLLVTLGSAAVRAFGWGKSAGAAGTAENGGAP
ncbi:MAG TPA: metal ABC transporter permease [Clostridiales bacterium]|nr:metal ABC transporter permease [Clostridiales bacterium]